MLLFVWRHSKRFSSWSMLDEPHMHLPGIGAIYKSQTLEFLRPVFIGDTVCAWFEIIAINPETEQIDIRSWIENQNGENVIQGQAVVSLLRGFKRPETRKGG